ncbi:sensory histidine kinase UhpB [compost metagenome]
MLRHSQAEAADVEIGESGDKVYLTVTDNGIHTGDTPILAGYGLHGIAERCTAYGGSCSFSSVEPHGFRVAVVLPVEYGPIQEAQGE